MSEHREQQAGRGFGIAAADYVAGRPDYPSEAVAWLLRDLGRTRRTLGQEVRAPAGPDVADVGAGTGKLTAVLIAAGAEVVAVEPDAAMLAELEREVPCARAMLGTAEALPLPDASVDAVVFGQAWHWVDVEAASSEASRVLRPGGVLGLIWNVRDSGVDWVRALGDLMQGSAAEAAILQDGVRVAPPFEGLERCDWRWRRPMTIDQLVSMAASRSYVIALEPPARADLLHAVRELLMTHPATAGRTHIDLPYVTSAFRTTRP